MFLFYFNMFVNKYIGRGGKEVRIWITTTKSSPKAVICETAVLQYHIVTPEKGRELAAANGTARRWDLEFQGPTGPYFWHSQEYKRRPEPFRTWNVFAVYSSF